MLNYTKGNWQVHPDLKKIVSVSRGDGTFSTIAECRLIGNYQTAEIEAKANARLIAAAPDMYEVLRAFLSIVPAHYTDEQGAKRFHIPQSLFVAMKHAVAKAEASDGN